MDKFLSCVKEDLGETKKFVPVRVGLVQPDNDQQLTISCRSSTKQVACPLPGIIAFGTHTSKFQIFVPWKPHSINRENNKGCYTLEFKEPLPEYWNNLFQHFSFIPFILNPEEIKAVQMLFSPEIMPSVKPFENVFTTYGTLPMLLSLSGWEIPCSGISTVKYILYVGLHCTPWRK